MLWLKNTVDNELFTTAHLKIIGTTWNQPSLKSKSSYSMLNYDTLKKYISKIAVEVHKGEQSYLNRQFSGILCLKRITVLSTKHKHFVDPKKETRRRYLFLTLRHLKSLIWRLALLKDKKSWKSIFQTVLNNIAVIWRFLLSSQRTQVFLIRRTQSSLFTALFFVL